MPRKSLRLNSVKVRLAFWVVGVQIFVLLGLGLTLRYVMRISLLNSMDQEMARLSHHHAPNHGHDAKQLPPDRQRSDNTSTNVSQADTSKSNVARPDVNSQSSPRDAVIPLPPTPLDLQGRNMRQASGIGVLDRRGFDRAKGGIKTYSTIVRQGTPVRVLYIPIRQNAKVIGVLQVTHSMVEIDQEIAGLMRGLLMIIPIALVVTGLSSVLLMHRLLRPVRDVRCLAEGISAADLSRRLPIVGDDEFAKLSLTINDMLARLEQAFDRQKRFTADASHELKTPLTVIKANSSLALSGKRTPEQYVTQLQAIDRSANVMGRIIQDLLLLARSDAGQLELDMRPIPIRSVLDSAVEQVEGSGDAKIDMSVEDTELMVLGDSAQLIRLFSNLLGNARRHTPADGNISVRATGDGRVVTLQIRDTGEGIAAEHLPHICERFYRVDAARTRKCGGTGLGLAISQTIVSAHGGKLSISSTLGEGTVVTVTLPQAA